MIEEKLLKNEEKAVYALRRLYRRYGYLPFKMHKFEEYDLYLRNKDFLNGEGIISFYDTDGTLMALKPDVTLSIVKNVINSKEEKQKLFYDENVYRISPGSKSYKEIMQSGLECIGNLDIYDLFEVIFLAAASLAAVSSRFLLRISHLGIVHGLLEDLCPAASFREKALFYISAKNKHELQGLAEQYGLSAKKANRLTSLADLFGPAKDCFPTLEELCREGSAASSLEQLRQIRRLLDKSPYAPNIILDFSVMNNMHYYNGIVFQGFIEGISDAVLSGGSYDRFMQRMGSSASAIGFAFYLDALEALTKSESGCDIDIFILYDAHTAPEDLWEGMQYFIREGKSVRSGKALPGKLRVQTVLDWRKEEAP